MEKEYAIGIDLGTSVKYALIDNNGVFYFQGSTVECRRISRSCHRAISQGSQGGENLC